jgi:hypothetical protein
VPGHVRPDLRGSVRAPCRGVRVSLVGAASRSRRYRFSYLVVNVQVNVVDPTPVLPVSGLPAASRIPVAPPVSVTR